VTRRKPPGASWESWIDRQVREAEERGEFDDLPGAGRPIPGLDKPFDELWEANRKNIPGPPLMLVPYDVDNVVRQWHQQHRG
jgi:Domain of unknown function (DUF1992)